MTIPTEEKGEQEGSPRIKVVAEQTEPVQITPQRMRVRLPQRTPYVAYFILFITIGVYALQMLTQQGLLDVGLGLCPYFFSPDLPACYGLKVNDFILTGQYWRLITPVLLHGSLLHVGFNMYALYALGPELERHLGHWQFFLLYLSTGFAGTVASFLLTDAPSLGASTAIFGLLAAQGVFIYRNQRVFGPRARLVLRNLINIALINFFIGLSPGIDNWGHFGGFVGGVLFTWLAAPDYRIVGEEPEYSLENKRSNNAAAWAAMITIGVFILLAAVPIVQAGLA